MQYQKEALEEYKTSMPQFLSHPLACFLILRSVEENNVGSVHCLTISSYQIINKQNVYQQAGNLKSIIKITVNTIYMFIYFLASSTADKNVCACQRVHVPGLDSFPFSLIFYDWNHEVILLEMKWAQKHMN